MKLILITTPEYFVEEDQILNALFEEGLDILHLRKPGTEAVPDNYSGHISASCHTLEEVQEDKKTCDYVFLSPIFDSISKEGYSSKFTPEAIREAVKADIIDKKVIALGGIDEENILRVKDFGFGGAAILGGLWSKFNHNFDNNYQELIDHFRKLKRLAD